MKKQVMKIFITMIILTNLFYGTWFIKKKKRYSEIKGMMKRGYEMLFSGKEKESLDIFKDIEKKFSCNKSPELYGELKFGEGCAYYTLAVKQGNVEGNLVKSIEAEKEAIKGYKEAKKYTTMALVYKYLALSYFTLADYQNEEENLEKAISSCGKALKVYSKKEHSLSYSSIQMTLGDIYVRFASVKNKKENLNRALICYKEALNTCSPKIDYYSCCLSANKIYFVKKKIKSLE